MAKQVRVKNFKEVEPILNNIKIDFGFSTNSKTLYFIIKDYYRLKKENKFLKREAK